MISIAIHEAQFEKLRAFCREREVKVVGFIMDAIDEKMALKPRVAISVPVQPPDPAPDAPADLVPVQPPDHPQATPQEPNPVN